MLECSGCLRGFHMRCLKPPLKAVPDGDWLCRRCGPPAARAPARAPA
jgi:origin recognition complex subunit 1